MTALLAELLALFLGSWTRVESFTWPRVTAHLGGSGGVVLLLASVAAALPWRLPRGRAVLLAASFGLHLSVFRVAQAQPDTAFWFTLAGHVARDPLGTILHWPAVAWGGGQGAFHHPLPGVPLLYGAAYALFGDGPVVSASVMAMVAVALPQAVVSLGATRSPGTGLAAGWLTLGIAYWQAQAGWMLADLPLTLALVLAWTGLARRSGGHVAAAVACLVKPAAVLWLVLPWLAARRRWRWGLAVAALAIALRSPRLHPVSAYLGPLAAVLLLFRPSLFSALRPPRDRLDRIVAGGLGALAVIVALSPPDHLARYALPVAPLLAVAGARLPGWTRRAIVVSGAVLLVGGFAPIARHHQATNIQLAIREAGDAASLEVWGDMPGTSFSVEALTALVDFEATVPVYFGGALARGESPLKRRWWQAWQPPPWQFGGRGDVLLLADYDGSATLPGTFLGTVSAYRGSSQLHPKEIHLFRRER